jgi:hypothetical protein
MKLHRAMALTMNGSELTLLFSAGVAKVHACEDHGRPPKR